MYQVQTAYGNMKILLQRKQIHILIQTAGANSVIANGIRTYTAQELVR